MIASTSASDRRTATLGLSAVVGLLLLGRGVPALWAATHDARVEARALQAQLAESRMLIARSRGAATSPEAAMLGSAVFRAVSRAGLASAGAAAVASVARDAGVKTTQLRADSPDSARAGLVRVAVALAGECDISSCLGAIGRLEAARPALRIARLRLVTSDVAAPADRAERIQFEMLVDALGLLGSRP